MFVAVGVAVVFGTPLLILSAKHGISFPSETIEDYGMAIPPTLFPAYSIGLVVGTVITIMIVVTIVSYMPSKRISKMKPTEALKGKIT